MTIDDWKNLAAVVLFCGAGVKALAWLVDRFSAHLDTRDERLTAVVTSAVERLTDGLDGIREEIGELRGDFHTLGVATAENTKDIAVLRNDVEGLKNFEVVKPPRAPRKSARRRES
jgi:hypothetical protein